MAQQASLQSIHFSKKCVGEHLLPPPRLEHVAARLLHKLCKRALFLLLAFTPLPRRLRFAAAAAVRFRLRCTVVLVIVFCFAGVVAVSRTRS